MQTQTPLTKQFAVDKSFSPMRSDFNPIRVVLVEDDMATAQRLIRQFEQDGRIQTVLWASSAREAIDGIDRLKFDLALVDLGLPDQPGTSVIEYITDRYSDIESVVLSTFGDTTNVMRAIRAGASGYLLKGQAEAQAVIDGLVAVARGEASISPAIARHLLDSFRSPEKAETGALSSDIQAGAEPGRSQLTREESESLTRREQQMLSLVAHGYMVKEIAKKLSLSPHTVSTHFKNIYRKLHVKTRGEAVFMARQAGLI